MQSIDIEQADVVPPASYPWRQIIILFILYVIQAVPMGLSVVIPLVLQNRGASYSEIAAYAMASLPFSLKLIWAPIVDSTHLPGVGRRKSWLVPTQLACALTLLITGSMGWLGSWIGENGEEVQVAKLTAVFFFIYILMATQDIAVDGWAIEILPHPYKKHASTCNAIGQTVGSYTASLIFLFLNDADACNRWFRSEPQPRGIVSIGGFVNVCAWIILLVTIYVGVFVDETFESEEERPALAKLEDSDPAVDSEQESLEKIDFKGTAIADSYILLLQMIRMWPVQVACLFLLTIRLPFAAIDGALQLKLIEAGVKKEEVALVAPFVIPWGVLASYTAGRVIHRHWTALQAFHIGFHFRLFMIVVWIVVFLLVRDVYTPFVQDSTSSMAKASFWILIYACACLQTIATEFMFACQIAFFAHVSDPAIGGTAMTFFNTLANLGNKYPSMVALLLMGKLQVYLMDTFVFLALLGFGSGLLWMLTGGRTILRLLDAAPLEAWRLVRPKESPRESIVTVSSPTGTPDVTTSHLSINTLLNRRPTPAKLND